MKMFTLKDWSQLGSRSSTVRDIYEKGGGIIFPDRISAEDTLLVLSVCPFIKDAVDGFVRTLRERTQMSVPPYLYLKEGKLIEKLFFIRKHEKEILDLVLDLGGLIFMAIPNLRSYHHRLGMKISKEPSVAELLGVLGGVTICFPINSELLEILSERTDIVLIGGQVTRSSFPTYVEAIERGIIRVVYEGVVPKHILSEKLERYGVKVL